MAPLHLLGHGDSNEVQHDSFGHMMHLALVLESHGANGILNDTIAFVGSRRSK